MKSAQSPMRLSSQEIGFIAVNQLPFVHFVKKRLASGGVDTALMETRNSDLRGFETRSLDQFEIEVAL